MILSAITDKDVLLGRGTGPNNHVGNQKFRAMAENMLKEYVTNNNKEEEEEDAVETSLFEELGRQLIVSVHNKGGKFVRKLSKDENATVAKSLWKNPTKAFLKKHQQKNLYVVVPEDVALSKAKQSFRHQVRKNTTKHGQMKFTTKARLSPKAKACAHSTAASNSGRHSDDSSCNISPAHSPLNERQDMEMRQLHDQRMSSLSFNQINEVASNQKKPAALKQAPPTQAATDPNLVRPIERSISVARPQGNESGLEGCGLERSSAVSDALAMANQRTRLVNGLSSPLLTNALSPFNSSVYAAPPLVGGNEQRDLAERILHRRLSLLSAQIATTNRPTSQQRHDEAGRLLLDGLVSSIASRPLSIAQVLSASEPNYRLSSDFVNPLLQSSAAADASILRRVLDSMHRPELETSSDARTVLALLRLQRSRARSQSNNVFSNF